MQSVVLRASKILLRLVAALFAGAVIVVGAGSWRLAQGPVSIAFLSPYIKEALTAGGADANVVIADTVLAWRGFERGLDIVVLDLDLLDAQGNVVARVPELSVGLSPERLLLGDFVPTTVDVSEAKLNLRRNANGVFEIGLNGNQNGGGSILALLRDLTLAPDPRRAGASLRRISIVDSSFVFEDAVRGVTWTAPQAALIVNRGPAGLDGNMLFELDVDGSREDFIISAAFDYVTRVTAVSVDFSDVIPAAFADKDPMLAPLARLNIPTTGKVAFDLSEAGHISGLRFELEGGEGGLDLGPVFDEPSRVSRVSARGEIDQDNKTIVFATLRLERGQAVADLSGRVSQTESGPHIALSGRVSGFRPSDIDEYWPPGFASPVHRWFASNIKEGVVTEGTVRLNIGPEQLSGAGLSADAAEARLSVKGVTATYFGAMPPISEGSGTLRLTGDTLDLDLNEGLLGNLVIKEGALRMVESAPRVWNASLEFVASGRNDDALKVIDSEPLRLARRFGIAPNSLGGLSATRVRIGFPVRRDITPDQVEFAAATNIRDAEIKQAFGGIDLSRGNMTLEITKAGLRGGGNAALSGIPVDFEWEESFQPQSEVTTALKISGRFDDAARRKLGLPTGDIIVGEIGAVVDMRAARKRFVDAKVDLDLTPALIDIGQIKVTKLPSRPARASFYAEALDDGGVLVSDAKLTSGAISLSGLVELGPDRSLRRIDLDHLGFGRTDVAVSMRPRAPNGYILAINGPAIDAGPFLDSFFEQTGSDLPPLNLSVTTREMILSERRTLFDVSAELNYVDQLEFLQATGSVNNEAPLKVTLITTPEGPRRLTISGTNAGGLARSTGLFDDAVGGSLLVSASLRDSDEGPVIDGRMEIEGLRVRQATSLSRVLTLASLTGILEVLNGDGLQFARADVPFRFHDGMLEIIDARAFGPSLGITLDGEINGDADEISMFGTIVPAYTINSVLGEIPLIGTLLVGKQGQGVFALTYGVRGPVEQPIITVNPLSALAPGFLRNFFAIFTGAPADPDDPSRPFLEDQPG
jgi:hypothetical protein